MPFSLAHAVETLVPHQALRRGIEMENAGYLIAAFAVVWAAVFGYVFSLFNRQRKLRREIDSLKEVLKEKEGEQ